MKLPLLLFYAAGTLAAPFMALDDNLPKAPIGLLGNCKTTRFNQGKTYAYEYAGETINNIEGASIQSTGIRIKSRVLVTPLAECKFTMSLSNTELFTKSKNQDFSRSQDSAKLQRDLEKHELLFTMNGNKITSLVAHSMESTNTLNIKRGILSTLQVDQDTTQETDVNGVCETAVVKESDNTFVETKKLSDCSERAQNEYGIQAASFKSGSPVQPLDSTSKCTYTMKGDMISTVQCDEQHIFRPFSAGYNSPSGAMTIVKQTMKFVSFVGAPAIELSDRDYSKTSTLVFDHTKEEEKFTNVLTDTAESIMSALVNKNKLSAQQSSAHEFTALVMVLRKMNKKAMLPVWDKYFNCIKSGSCKNEDVQGVYRQYLLDAIAYCGTSTCVSFVHDVIIDGEVKGERVNMFLQSIALVAETTKDMIRDVLDIVKKQPSRQAYLTLGTLMYRHCKKASSECDFSKNSIITTAELFLEQKLGSACEGQKNYQRVEEILMALKAIGNARRPLRARGVLLKCAENAIHANITHSAFHAFKNMPCKDQLFTDEILNFIRNVNIDPEKRIHAFGAALQCPSEYLLERLVNALEIEKSKQVASYMYTQLSNILESNNPENEYAKELLTKITKTLPLVKVDLPFYQYSKFYEKTVGIKDLSATTEGQVIFHPDGFLPRTGMMNLKGNVLGRSINIFETLVHVEGAEDWLSDMIGINGVFSKDLLVEIFNTSMTAEKLKEIFQRRQESTRTKREAKMGEKLNKIHNTVDMKPSKPTAHLSMKIMGQEVRVITYDDLYWLIDEIDNMNVIQLMTDIARGGHKTFTKSFMFLEMSHVVPTGMGLPLKLKMSGSSVASVELDGRFDIRNMFWGPGSIHVKGSIKPSAVVEMTGQMGIDSAYATSGVFVNTSMFTSNMLKGNIIYENGKLLKINLDTPEEPIQLFNVSSTPYMYMNENQDLIEGTERKISPDYCVKSKIIGYGLCTSVRLPFAFREYEAPYFPLSGPAHFGVNLIRGDEKLTTYQFLVKMSRKGKDMYGDVEFSTPGAYYDRKIGGSVRYTDAWGAKTLTFLTEKNGKSAQLQVSYNPNQKRHFIEGRTNFFTPKEVVSRLEVFKTGNMVSEQYGVSYSMTYDWYKFEHVTKFVKKENGYMLHSSTVYYPKKSVAGVLEYNTKEHKLIARFNADQFKQAAFEFSGQLKKAVSGNGIILTGTHMTTKKAVSLFLGYVNEDNKKEFKAEIDIVGKKATSVMGYYNRNGLKSYEHVVMVNGKTGKFMATLENGQTTKRVEMNFVVDGKRMAESSAVVTNTATEKSLLLSATAAGKTATSKAGYYVQGTQKSVKVEFNADGRKAEVFFNLQQYSYTFGGLAGKYSAGVRGIYRLDGGKKVCMSMYYGLTGAEQEPMNTCVGYDSLANDYFYKRLYLNVEMKKISKSFSVNLDLKKQGKESSVVASAMYNNRELVNQMISLTYDGLMNTEVKYRLIVDRYYGGLNLFTRSKKNTGNFGVEGYFMEKTIMVINRWHAHKMEKSSDRAITTEVVVNGKTLPVSTTFSMLYEKGSFSPSARLTMGKYDLSYATMINYASADYSIMDEIVLTNDGKSVFKVYRKSGLTLTDKKKEFVQKVGAVLFGKTYEYGWETAFENQGTASKTAFGVIFRLQYSTTRKSVVTFTFANNKKASSLFITVEYIPTKSVTHTFIFDKNLNELNVNIEFLPKMHTKFMARLDTKNGYKLTTDFGLQWNKYKRFAKIVNHFKNNENKFEVSTKFGESAKFGLTINKGKKIILEARIMKTNMKAIATLLKNVVKFNLIKNGQVLANVGVGMQRAGQLYTFSLLKGNKKVFSVSADYNRFINEVYLAVKSGKKELLGLSGRLDKSRGMLTGSVSYARQVYFKVVAKKTNKLVSLKFAAPTMKRDITFAAELFRGQKMIILSAESGKVRVGVEARADWTRKIASFNGFFNKHVAGVSLTATKNAIKYKMTFTPKVSLSAVFEIVDDKVLKMTIIRQSGKKMIKETSMKYRLSRKMSQFVLQWNTEYFNRLSKFVTPKINNLMKKMTNQLRKARVQSTEYAKKYADKMAKAAMDFVDNADQSFDNIDFVGARDKVGATALSGVKKMSELVQTAFKQLIKALKTIRNEMPKLRAQLDKATTKTIEYLRTMPKDLEANWKLVSVQLKEIQRVLMIVSKNLTDSSLPVVNKAVELIKKFKLRGKTMEELSVMAKTKVEELIKVYMKLAKEQIEILKIQGQKFYDETSKKVLKMKIPYRKETVAEGIEMALAKFEELKLKIKEIDAEKLFNDAKTYAMDYKIKGLTTEQHLNNLKKTIKSLPAESKKVILDLIKLMRKYTKEVEIFYGKVVEFAEPMTNHVIFVKDSAVKRFGPLYKDAVAVLEAEFNKLDLEIPYLKELTTLFNTNAKRVEDFFLPLAKPWKPFYKNILGQIRKLQVMGIRMGPMFDMNAEMVSNSIDQYVSQSRRMLYKQIGLMRNMVRQYQQMTPEEMVEKVFASSAEMSGQAMDYVTKVYNERQQWANQYRKQMEQMYRDLEAKYFDVKRMWNDFSAQKPENVLKHFYKGTEQRMITVVDEMHSITKQLAALDLASPSWKAWEEMDVLGHLNRYGVNQKTTELIRTLKDVKLTKVILNTIQMVKEFYNKVYAQVFVKAVQTYGRVEMAVKYLKSIPKKEYEEWYQELKTFTLDNKDQFIGYLTKNYQVSKEAATKYYSMLMTMSTKKVDEIKKAYDTKAKPTFDRVVRQSQLFYDDVKQPTIDVANHYKTIATTFVNKYYTKYEKIVMKYYDELKVKVQGEIEKINTQIRTQYQNFLNKYGDMTWEQVGDEMVKYGEEKYALAEKEYTKTYKKVEKLVAEYKQKAEELYKKAQAQYEKYMARFENEIKPKVMAKYQEIRTKVETLIAEYKVKGTELLNKVKAEAMKLKNKGMEIYNANKDKTFKTLYREIKAIIVKEAKAQYAKATRFYDEKSEMATRMAKDYYKKLNTITVDKILPEVSLEMQSLINQTLKNSVIMAEEIVKAYTPHYNLIKRETIKYSKVVVEKMAVVIEQSKVELKKTMDKLDMMVKDLIQKLKEHEYTEKAIEFYKKTINHKYVTEAKAKIEKFIKMVQEKVEEIKAHPMTKKYVKIAQKKIRELKGEVKALEKKVQKLMKEKEYKQLVRTLKQIQTSLRFTYNKLVEKMTPHVQRVRDVARDQMEVAPAKAQKAFTFFRQEPEEAFWTAIKLIREAVMETYETLATIDMELIKAKQAEYMATAKQMALETVDDITDEWTKTTSKKLYRDAVKMTKKAEKKLKALPERLRKMAKREIKERMHAMKKWCKQTYNTLLKQWEDCPYKAFVDNQIWGEIVDEIKNHELTEATYAAADFAAEKAEQLKAFTIKEFNKQKEILKNKLAELKVLSEKKMKEMKQLAQAKYAELKDKVNDAIAKVDNFLETTTIADVVAFVEKKIEELKVKALDAKVKLEAAYKKNMEKAKKLMKEYELKAKKMYEDAVVKAKALYKKHVEPKVNEYRAKAMAYYNKYYPQMEAKYLELKEKAMEKYQLYSVEAKKLIRAYRIKATELYQKMKADAYNKWMSSEVRAKLITLKGMTIKETIEALKKLPKQTETFVKAKYAEYSAMALAEFNEKYAKLMKEFETRRDQLVEMAKPYTTPAYEAYKWVENEIKETAIFVYRYHRIQERSLKLKEFVTSEFDRLLPIVKANMQRLAEEYKVLAQEYRIKGQKMAYDALTNAGHKTLRGIHSGLRYVDSIDMNKYHKQIRAKFTEINNYIAFDEGKITITIPHGEVTPKISYHIKKVGIYAERTIRDVKQEGQKMLKKLKTEYAKLQARSAELRKKITKAIMDNTAEIREDLKDSYAVNKKVAKRVYEKATILGQKAYKKALVKYNNLKSKADIYAKKAKALTQKYYKKLVEITNKIYMKSSDIFMDIYSAGVFNMHKRAYFHAEKYYSMVEKEVKQMVAENKPFAKKMYTKYLSMIKAEGKKMQQQLMPYYRALEKAYRYIRQGVPVEKAMKPFIRQIAFVYREYQRQAIAKLSKAKSSFCRTDAKLCRHMKESARVHKRIFEKYFARFMDKAAVVKARLDRNMRKLSTYTTRPLFADYNVVASMFGDHVLTFDKKYFQMVQNNKDCSYLLAHDFSEGQFTVKTVGKNIVAKTPDMIVTITHKGEVKATVGDKTFKSLPVQSKSGHCIRKESSVICHFVSNSFKIVVDLENEITTLSVSGWYFGKTQGIFGTYNRESYDDWKLPNGDVTNDVYKFMNSYELSGKRKCQLKAPVTKTKKCKEFPSRQCFKFFSQASSPFVKYFEASELEPFWQACIHDTTPCNNKKVHYNDFCKSVTAFVASARAAGKWIDFPSKCSSYNNIKAGSEFTQKPLKKALDVVILVSQQEAQQKYTRRFNAFLQTLHRMLKNKKKMNIRYSVVGFGGVGVAEEAHVKSIGKDIFMNMQQATKVLKTLNYNGQEAQSNDGFMAITEAASLPFRAGSSKLFVLFNTEEHRAHTFGASLDEARYVISKEVEGTLIVFSDVEFKQKRVFGQSTRHLYTNKKTITGKFDFPATDYKQIIEDTQGGIFKKDFVNPIAVAKASYEIVSQKIRENTEHCKLCRVVTSPLDGTAKAICRSIKDMKCDKKITTYKGTLNGFFFE